MLGSVSSTSSLFDRNPHRSIEDATLQGFFAHLQHVELNTLSTGSPAVAADHQLVEDAQLGPEAENGPTERLAADPPRRASQPGPAPRTDGDWAIVVKSPRF